MLARALATIAVLGVTLLVAETLRAMPAGLAALGLAVFGAALAPMLCGAPSPLAVGLGALGALAWALLRPSLPIPAGALLFVMLFAARALRARDAASVVLQLAVAAIAGASATWIVLRYASIAAPGGSEPIVRAVAIGVAALIAAAPFALAARSPRVAALLSLARRTRGPARARLLRAAALEERTIESAFPIARAERRRLERALRTVTRLAEARAEAGAVDLAAIDRALAAHVDGVARLARALRARWASGEGLRGAEAREVIAASERLAAEAAALDELA